MSPSDAFRADNTTPLTEGDVADAARDLDVETAALWAVVDVESGGAGFRSDGLPALRYEGHVFSELTGRRYDASHPDTSWAGWQVHRPSNRAALDRAMVLDRAAALQATSWGMFQILARWHERCGFDDPETFVIAHRHGEVSHLGIAGRFIEGEPTMLRALRDHRWADFAYRYNGSGYAANAYDVKLGQAYQRRSAGPVPRVLRRGMQGDDVRALQRALTKAGALPFPLVDDGIFGTGTEEVLIAYQAAHGLDTDGAAGPKTLAALGLA